MARRGQTIESLRVGQRITFLDTAEETDGELLRLEATQAPGKGVPPHVHPAQEEQIDVVKGEIKLLVGRRSSRRFAGESAIAPAGTAHGFRAHAARAARLGE